jgi:hypothetical protein
MTDVIHRDPFGHPASRGVYETDEGARQGQWTPNGLTAWGPTGHPSTLDT